MRSLNDFKTNLQKLGTVSQNRFEVFFNRAAASWPNAPKDLTFRCESLNIPGSQVLTTDYRLYGGQPFTKVPNGRSVDEVQMTFLAAGDMRDKYYFDEWIEEITDYTNNTVAYYDNVASNVDIIIFNEYKFTATAVSSGLVGEVGPATVRPTTLTTDLTPIYTIRMVKAIPTRAETMQVSWADNDQLLRYTVNFSCEALQFKKDSNITQLNFRHLDKVQK